MTDLTVESMATTGIPIHDRRPDFVERTINRKIRRYSSGVPRMWSFHGYDSQYSFLAPRVNSGELIEEIADKKGRPLRILDIGCGMGQLVAKAQLDGHDAQGLSAYKYLGDQNIKERLANLGVHKTDKPVKGSYITGDANRLDSIEGLYDEYDLILSRWTFVYLAEPLGTLEQAADRLAVGGVMAVSHLTAPYIDYQECDNVTGRAVLRSISDGGLKVLSSFPGHFAEDAFEGVQVVAQKSTTDVSLCFNFGFEQVAAPGHPTHWEYTPSSLGKAA